MGRLVLSLAFLLLHLSPAAAQDNLEKDFKIALQLQNASQLEKVCRVIVTHGTADDAKLILGGIQGTIARPDMDPDVYWILVRAAAAFQNSNGLNITAKFVVDQKTRPVARDLCMALHNNFSAPVEEALCSIVTGGTEELRVSALDHLMDVGKKPAVTTAVELLRKEPKLPVEVSKRCFRLLTKLTKQDFGENVSNWIGWWDAHSSKAWEEITKTSAGEGGTTTLGSSRQDDYDKLKDAKVLILRAGDKCKCKKNHDLDNGIDGLMNGQPWTTESMTKDVFESDAKVTPAWLGQNFIGIIAICTHIREHCACPDCKPGGNPSMRLYQCTGCNKHDRVTFKLGKKGTSKIKQYVDNGGYLFAEDWALEEIIEPEWGNILWHSTYLKEQEIPVLPKPGTGTHPYLRKIFVKPPSKKESGGTTVEEDVAKLDYVYKIDQDAPAISIKDKKSVTVLMFSQTLLYQSEKENGSDAVTVTFMSGAGKEPDPVATGRAIPQTVAGMRGGRVIHTLAHFGKQPKSSGGDKGEYALTNLLINFLIEANERRLLQNGK